jgi:hypothetical protein
MSGGKLVLVAVALTAIGGGLMGCAAAPAPARVLVGRDEFLRYWELPTKSGGVRVVYRGCKDDYHMMDYYDLGTTTYEYGHRLTLVTPRSELEPEALWATLSEPVMPLSKREVDPRADRP